jgi:hypothetical protein
MKKLNTTIFIITLIGTLFYNPTFASDTDTLKCRYAFSASNTKGIKSDNGFNLGIERFAFETGKINVMQNASLLIQQRSDVYTCLTFTIGSTLRRNYKYGFYFDHSIKAGYAGHYYKFDIFETNSNNDIVNVGHKWISSMIVGYSFAVGYNLSGITNQDIRIFAKPNIYLKVPNKNNLFLLNNFYVEMGIAFRPKKKRQNIQNNEKRAR